MCECENVRKDNLVLETIEWKGKIEANAGMVRVRERRTGDTEIEQDHRFN